VAAISAIGPSERLDARRLKRTAPLVVTAADALAKDLGWRPPLTRARRHAKL
jgi:DNA-binding IclR family transcriptional regulator